MQEKFDHGVLTQNHAISLVCLDFPNNELKRSNYWKKHLGKLKLKKCTVFVMTAIRTNYQEMQ